MARLCHARVLWTDRQQTASDNAGRTEWHKAVGFWLLSPIFWRTGDLVWGLEYFRLRALQQIDKPTLGAGVTVDIGLGVLDRTVAGQLLNIAQAATRLEHEPGSIGDERAAPRVRCAALESEFAIEPGEPVHDAARTQRLAALGPDDWPARPLLLLKPPQRPYQIRMQRDRPAASLLCRGVVELDMACDVALRVDHHRPGQLGDLAGAQARLDRQEDHDAIAIGIPTVSDSPQGCRKLLFCERFSVSACHF